MVRIYWPGLSLDDPAGLHPLRQPRGGVRFVRALVREIADATALRHQEDELIAAALRPKDPSATPGANPATGVADLEQSYLELVEQYDALKAENGTLLYDRERLSGDLMSALGNVDALSREIGIAAEAGYESIAEPHAVKLVNVEDAVKAAAEDLAGSEAILIADNAFASSSDSPYGRPDKIYDTLIQLAEVAEEYRVDAVGPLVNAMRDMGLKYAADVSDTAKQKYMDHYLVTVEDQDYHMGAHIILGVGGPDTCARIYFAKDSVGKRFIVGHVGLHLPDAGSS